MDQSKTPPDDSANKPEPRTESERIFREFLTRRESEEGVSIDDYIRKHPELEGELKRLYETHETKEAEVIDLSHKEDGGIPQKIGDFKIIKELGRGAMGVVYEAEQASLKRTVALKVLPSHLSFSDEAVRKFKREAEAGGRQSHPGIVAIHAVGEQGGVHYIAEELVEGGRTLANKLDELQKSKEQPSGYFRETATLVSEVADALAHAHGSAVIHRDIKPSNILLTPEGDPKVTDFGLAKVEDALSLSRTGDFAGTPYYMSPEQAMSRRMGIDKRTDIYSLGVTLYEMLTLKRPFDGETSHEVFKKIMLIDPKEPFRINPRTPKDLSTICMKAMEKLPDKRYQSMKEFVEDLKRFLSGDVILAKPTRLGTRFWKCVKRNPVVSAVVGVTIAAGLTFALVVPWMIDQKKEETKEQAQRELKETVREMQELMAEERKYRDVIEEEKARIAKKRREVDKDDAAVTQESDPSENSMIEDSMERVYEVVDAGGLAALGIGESKRYSMACTKARERARAEIAFVIESKIDALRNEFLEEIGEGQDAEVDVFFSTVKKLTTGVGVPQQSTVTKDGITKAVAIVVINPKLFMEAIADQEYINKNLYTRFRASETFKEFEKEVEKYQEYEIEVEVKDRIAKERREEHKDSMVVTQEFGPSDLKTLGRKLVERLSDNDLPWMQNMPTLAILDFRNKTDKPDLNKQPFFDEIETAMFYMNKFDLIDYQETQRLLKQVGYQQSDAFDFQTAVKMGEAVRARYVMWGDVSVADHRVKDAWKWYSLSLNVTDVESHRIIYRDKEMALDQGGDFGHRQLNLPVNDN